MSVKLKYIQVKKFASVIFIMLLATTLSYSQDEFTLVKEGQKAPDFSFEVKEGVSKKLSDLKGKVVWINFFATWCPPCRQELPHLEKEVFEKYKENKEFELLVIGREHSWAEIKKFKTENKFKLPFYPDPKRKIFSVYAKQNIPRNFIIDKEGKIVVASTGFNKEGFEKIKQKVAELLQ